MFETFCNEKQVQNSSTSNQHLQDTHGNRTPHKKSRRPCKHSICEFFDLILPPKVKRFRLTIENIVVVMCTSFTRRNCQKSSSTRIAKNVEWNREHGGGRKNEKEKTVKGRAVKNVVKEVEEQFEADKQHHLKSKLEQTAQTLHWQPILQPAGFFQSTHELSMRCCAVFSSSHSKWYCLSASNFSSTSLTAFFIAVSLALFSFSFFGPLPCSRSHLALVTSCKRAFNIFFF